jgi:hypothetical protein
VCRSTPVIPMIAASMRIADDPTDIGHRIEGLHRSARATVSIKKSWERARGGCEPTSMIIRPARSSSSCPVSAPARSIAGVPETRPTVSSARWVSKVCGDHRLARGFHYRTTLVSTAGTPPIRQVPAFEFGPPHPGPDWVRWQTTSRVRSLLASPATRRPVGCIDIGTIRRQSGACPISEQVQAAQSGVRRAGKMPDWSRLIGRGRVSVGVRYAAAAAYPHPAIPAWAGTTARPRGRCSSSWTASSAPNPAPGCKRQCRHESV